MTVDWKLNKLQREAQAKREQLDLLNRTIQGLDAMLEEARSFEGHFAEKLAAADRRIREVATLFGSDVAGPYIVQKGDPAECERRQGEREAIEREKAEEMARRTHTSYDSGSKLTFCELSPHDVIGQRARIVVFRDRVARELADVEAQMTPGELVESGVPAADYAEHRERVQALRERIGAAS